jgi:citrate/tricarballylate utilization protein
MPHSDPLAHGAHVLTVCNACRYCEQFCPVFPAIEQRVVFEPVDLAYLANLCHNCGECLYACPYAPPHEFGINVPRTLAEIRLDSYEHYAWPRPLAALLRRNAPLTTAGLVAAFTALFAAAAVLTAGDAVWRAPPLGDFYAVVPHAVMVAVFGSVFVFAMLALAIGVARFAGDVRRSSVEAGRSPAAGRDWRAIRDALTLRHLHAAGADCVSREEERRPWRRWCHHLVLGGFLLCLASTTVAAIYHGVFGWLAPYGLTSLPVVLGTLGGVGLAAGSTGLWVLHGRRDPSLGDPAQSAGDRSFLALLFATTVTGLALLGLRTSAAMGVLLIVHLATVLALFVMLPYGKFVHGFYRAAALVAFERERDSASPH